jgi:hypothetical protein
VAPVYCPVVGLWELYSWLKGAATDLDARSHSGGPVDRALWPSTVRVSRSRIPR